MKTHLSFLDQTIVGLALTVLQGHAQSIYEPYTFTTLAGSAGNDGSADGLGSTARFGYRGCYNGPMAVAVDTTGNVYVVS